ncbi:hypothetical protein MAUB1S_05808 [Mycolicibacterium aubagnense]
MANPKFDRPVPIRIDDPHDVQTARDAYEVLTHWQGIPDLDHTGAIAVCRKALNGQRTGKEARQAFQRFAHNNRILADDPAGSASRQSNSRKSA